VSTTSRPFGIEPLHSMFAARLHGLDLGRELPQATLTAIVQAFDAYSVLVFPGQQLDTAEQVRFSECFGPLEKAISRQADTGPGLHVSYLSNVNGDGRLIPPDDRKQLFNAANQFWHTDSSYKPQPALASLLYAIEVPADGGQTEFASTRVGYRTLSSERRALIDGLWAVHDFQRSRDLVAPGLVDEGVQNMLPPVARPLVRVNPSNGERALYIATHAVCLEGMTPGESRPLLDELLDWCTRPACVYTHEWQVGDLVMWDNRCTLHRGRPWDASSERRIMMRTTVVDTGYDEEPETRLREARIE